MCSGESIAACWPSGKASWQEGLRRQCCLVYSGQEAKDSTREEVAWDQTQTLGQPLRAAQIHPEMFAYSLSTGLKAKPVDAPPCPSLCEPQWVPASSQWLRHHWAERPLSRMRPSYRVHDCAVEIYPFLFTALNPIKARSTQKSSWRVSKVPQLRPLPQHQARSGQGWAVLCCPEGLGETHMDFVRGFKPPQCVKSNDMCDIPWPLSLRLEDCVN